ncbi:MAG: hypothetical protein M3463_10130 [Verrucomicrobiota bacterium]|nr:hypothetical protein [Verrucomicrobiota bacterium]
MPTTIRHRVIGVTMLMAFLLYLDRICMGEIVKSVSFHRDPGLTKDRIGSALGAFFFALCVAPGRKWIPLSGRANASGLVALGAAWAAPSRRSSPSGRW